MTRILALAGRKQSGKDSAANAIVGEVLLTLNKIRKYYIDENGKLVVNYWSEDSEGMGILDLSRKDSDFVSWFSDNIGHYVKTYAFADVLKEASYLIFGIPLELMYGSNEDKNQKTNFKWKSMSQFLPPRTKKKLKDLDLYDEYLTVREFLEYFGTNVCRALKDSCWVEACLRRIYMDAPQLAIITDCRFPNEVKAIRDNGGEIIRLLRRVDNDNHDSETLLDEVPNEYFSLIIDNQNMSLEDKNSIVLSHVNVQSMFGELVAQ